MKTYFVYPILLLTAISFITACGSDDDEMTPNTENYGDNGNNGQTTTPLKVEEIIVSVDEKGYANEGHTFVQIDATNFYVDDIKYTADKGELTVTGYYEALFRGEAKIITALDFQGRHMMVRKIGKRAFHGCKELTSVAIPNSVIYVEESAFSGCTALTYLIIGNSVTSIGNYAFSGCSSLTSITIPNSVTSIGNYAFSGCSSLTSITIPNSVTSIGEYNQEIKGKTNVEIIPVSA